MTSGQRLAYLENKWSDKIVIDGDAAVPVGWCHAVDEEAALQ